MKGHNDIRLFLTDVDGTLTDGGMYYTAQGDAMKKFNTRDGMGLQLLQRTGVKVGIVTSEKTEIVTRRAQKLGLDYLVQGKRDGGKLAAALEICADLGITMEQFGTVDIVTDVSHLLHHALLLLFPVLVFTLEIYSAAGLKSKPLSLAAWC